MPPSSYRPDCEWTARTARGSAQCRRCGGRLGINSSGGSGVEGCHRPMPAAVALTGIEVVVGREIHLSGREIDNRRPQLTANRSASVERVRSLTSLLTTSPDGRAPRTHQNMNMSKHRCSWQECVGLRKCHSGMFGASELNANCPPKLAVTHLRGQAGDPDGTAHPFPPLRPLEARAIQRRTLLLKLLGIARTPSVGKQAN